MRRHILATFLIVSAVSLFFIVRQTSLFPSQENAVPTEPYESATLELDLPRTPGKSESVVPTTLDIFSSSEIPEEIQNLMWGKTIRESSLVQFHDLSYLTVTYLGFDNQKHVGNLIVNKQIANDVLDIFRVLLESKFLIEKMSLPDYYGGIDELSMQDNNTSAFNDRPIDDSGALSWHQLGLAIDINPLYNPYIHIASNRLEPSTAGEYLDRTLNLPGMIATDDICVSVFKEYGFTWGGDWITVKDYQHFEIPIMMNAVSLVPASTPDPSAQVYRVRKKWTDNTSQLGAFVVLDNAIGLAGDNKDTGHKVFDENGYVVYDPNTSVP